VTLCSTMKLIDAWKRRRRGRRSRWNPALGSTFRESWAVSGWLEVTGSNSAVDGHAADMVPVFVVGRTENDSAERCDEDRLLLLLIT